MTIRLSPSYTDEDFPDVLGLDDKVLIFADRVNIWQLEFALKLIKNNIPNRDTALLFLTFSLFEMIGKYRDGYLNNDKSRHYFIQGAMYVFQADYDENQQKYLMSLYENVRCGLFHIGKPSPDVLIFPNQFGSIAFNLHHDGIILNPDMLVSDLALRFNDYINELHDTKNNELRKKFERRFDFDN
jgi:hypothetical protein